VPGANGGECDWALISVPRPQPIKIRGWKQIYPIILFTRDDQFTTLIRCCWSVWIILFPYCFPLYTICIRHAVVILIVRLDIASRVGDLLSSGFNYAFFLISTPWILGSKLNGSWGSSISCGFSHSPLLRMSAKTFRVKSQPTNVLQAGFQQARVVSC
jgi:hypothetical protein